MKLPLIVFNVFFIALLLPDWGLAQATRRATGSYTVLQDDDMTPNQAERKARDLAMVEAINGVFGSYVEQETNMTIQDGRTDFRIYGNTRVKGDWIETIGESYTWNVATANPEKGERLRTSVTCKITGLVRELVPGPLIEFKPLNCAQLECYRLQFTHGDNFFLWFRSPVKGYISVFAEEGDSVKRILPSPGNFNDTSSFIEISGDREYWFFDDSRVNQPYSHPIILYTTNRERDEMNVLHLVFSTKPFVKPGLRQINSKIYNQLPVLSNVDFVNWLNYNRSAHPGFVDYPVRIFISPK